MKRSIPWTKDDTKPQQATRLTALWTETTLNQPRRRPVRGFGGRVMFYTEEGDQPVSVEGDLVVYAFADSTCNDGTCVPNRKFIFPADQLEQHASRTMLGPSYSFWIPWDEVGGPAQQLNLICRFEGSDGAVVMSDQSRHAMAGTQTMLADGSSPRIGNDPPRGVPSAVDQVSHKSFGGRQIDQQTGAMASPQAQMAGFPSFAATQSPIDDRRRMMTTTIAVPPNFNRHNAAVSQRGNREVAANVAAGRSYQNFRRTPQDAGNGAAFQGSAPYGLRANGTASPQPISQNPPAGQPVNQLSPLSTRFPRGRSRVLGGPIVRPHDGRWSRRPHRVGWPSDPRVSPESPPADAGSESSPSGR